MNAKTLIGSGEKIGLFTLPFLAVGLTLNITMPPLFHVGGPWRYLKAISVFMLIAGVVVWAWSAFLILSEVPRKRLISSGPYSLVKHPLYTGVAFLVLPSLGFLFNSWLGVVIGLTLYCGSRIFAPKEEEFLSKTFGPAWDDYCRRVKFPRI